MKKYILFVLISITCFFANAETYRVLYLGNSLTYVNNVPDLVMQIAKINGDTIIWDSNTPGGHKINQHAANPTSLSKISDQDWDFVILQAQSQETSFPDFQVDNEIVGPGKYLVDSIHRNNACTKVFFYMPPGWQNGDNMNCAGFPEICTYEGQYGRIRMAHGRFRDSMAVAIAPVGCAFRESRLADATLLNWSTDNVHFNLSGSYLAALVIYKSIIGRNTVGNSYNPGLSSSVRSFLQNIADRVVTDSSNSWKAHLGPAPADARMLIDSNVTSTVHEIVSLSDVSVNADTSWYLVTVKTYNGINDSTYRLPGGTMVTVNGLRGTRIFYQIQLIASSCGKSDTLTYFKDLNLPTGIEVLSNDVTFFPNPFKDKIFVEGGFSEVRFSLFGLDGKLISEGTVERGKPINLQHISSGTYVLELRTSSEKSYVFRKLVTKEADIY